MVEHSEGRVCLNVPSQDLPESWSIWTVNTGLFICGPERMVPEERERNKANLRRMVACWNACVGISDPETYLERARTMTRDHVGVVEHDALMTAERNELLAALREARAHIDIASVVSGSTPVASWTIHRECGEARDALDTILAKFTPKTTT